MFKHLEHKPHPEPGSICETVHDCAVVRQDFELNSEVTNAACFLATVYVHVHIALFSQLVLGSVDGCG